MVDRFGVVPADLRQDAGVWQAWAERVSAIADEVPLVGVDLQQLDFSVVTGAQGVAAKYRAASVALTRELATATEMMQGIAQKLTTVADDYAAAEETTLADIARIAGTDQVTV